MIVNIAWILEMLFKLKICLAVHDLSFWNEVTGVLQ